jgi:hypothetical protein
MAVHEEKQGREDSESPPMQKSLLIDRYQRPGFAWPNPRGLSVDMCNDALSKFAFIFDRLRMLTDLDSEPDLDEACFVVHTALKHVRVDLPNSAVPGET